MPWQNGYEIRIESGHAYTADDGSNMLAKTIEEMQHTVTLTTLRDDGMEQTELLAMFKDPDHAKSFIEEVLL